MSFIKMGRNLDDVPEESSVPGGREYDLVVVSRKDAYVKEDSGNTVINLGLRIEDPDYPDAKLVNHSLVFPGSEVSKETANMMYRGIKRFFYTFGIDYDGEEFDEESLDGAKGRCQLGEDEYQDEPVNKLRLPRIPQE